MKYRAYQNPVTCHLAFLGVPKFSIRVFFKKRKAVAQKILGDGFSLTRPFTPELRQAPPPSHRLRPQRSSLVPAQGGCSALCYLAPGPVHRVSSGGCFSPFLPFRQSDSLSLWADPARGGPPRLLHPQVSSPRPRLKKLLKSPLVLLSFS